MTREDQNQDQREITQRLERCAGLMQSMSLGAGSASSPPFRVGAIFRDTPMWGAGIGFYRMFVRSLELVGRESGVEVGLVVDRHDDMVMSKLAGLPGQRWSIVRREKKQSHWQTTAEVHGINAYIDLFEDQPVAPGVGVVSWIPDFQHRHMPELFTDADLENRNKSFLERLQKSQFVLCSSEAVATDLRTFLPEYADLAVVARFPSNLAFEAMPAETPAATLASYHLPERFALVANQFWSHKNHLVVLEGVARARDAGVKVPVVLTGLPLDHRDAANSPTSLILQTIAQLGLSGQVIPLGQVPYRHLIQLMRAACLIIQPSRFEGWSTIVQDGKALGKPLYCSNIPVHREQAPEGTGFFGCDAPEMLAELFVRQWSSLPAVSTVHAESAHLQNHLEVARQYGRIVLNAARQAHQAAKRSTSSSFITA